MLSSWLRSRAGPDVYSSPGKGTGDAALARLEPRPSGSGFSNIEEDGMIKQVFAGVVAIGSVSGVASAQSYISMSPPPAAFVPPLVVGVNPPTTTTTAASSRNSDQREVTIRNVVNGKGNTSVEKDLLAGWP